MSVDPIQSARTILDRALSARDSADISWIQPPPEQDGWTLAADALRFLDCLVRQLRPAHVIEFGAGLSTKVLARACAGLSSTCAISSIDHDPEFGVPDTKALAEGAANLSLSNQFAPLVARDYGGKLLPTYHLNRAKLASQAPADLVLIDGPPITLGGREGVLYQVLEFCRPGTIVLLDDAARESEQKAARNWQEILGESIELSQLPHFTKGMAAIIVHETVMTDGLWTRRLAAARRAIESFVRPSGSFILIESGNFGMFSENRVAVPLVRRGSEDWGAPENSEMAMLELELRRTEGASHFILPWTSFWWNDCYAGFIAALHRRFRCVCNGDLLLAFDLQQSD